MNRIDTINVSGFWGDRDLSLSLHPDVNFLIGINGSGKTTLINLVAAALSADYWTLDRLPFKQVEIRLAAVSGRKKPSILVEKIDDARHPRPAIKYSIRDTSSGRAEHYSMDEFEARRRSRYMRTGSRRLPAPPIFLNRVVEHLNRLVNVSWLSIHRTTLMTERGEDSSYESTVDKKLDDISNQFVRYFSALAQQGSILLENFQEEIFLSLLVRGDITKALRETTQLDISDEQEALVDIFRQFSLEETAYNQRVNRHFEVLQKAQGKLNGKEELSLAETATLLATMRIHAVVKKWNTLVSRRAEIFEPRRTFVDILNSLFQSKAIEITEENELIAASDSGNRLSAKHLSSGEKQLLIILGEALLQEKRPQIYIADEPELSLHVDWQEQLVDNLRKINPNAQVFVATHSPDIVSSYGNNVFDMRSLLS